MPDSFLYQSQQTPEERLWDLGNHLMAVQLDRMAVSNWLQGQALVARGAFKSNPIDEPKPIPRPGITDAQPAKKNRGMKALLWAVDPAKCARAGMSRP